MKRLNMVVEGHAEEMYVNEVLTGHLAQYDVGAVARRVEFGRTREKVHRGGLLAYPKLKKDVTNWLKQDRDAFVTTMVDLYALPDDFPGRAEGNKIKNPYDRVALLEQAFGRDIGLPRFIPNIQLHEFEALLFVDIGKLKSYYPYCPKEIDILQTENAGLNPELIDEGKTTAPSKRVLKHVPFYDKSTVGVLTAVDIGLNNIRAQCGHFDAWLTRLESLASQRP
jgi:hypothetical protein